jgi:hypothetical protein
MILEMVMGKFVDRTKELECLEKQYNMNTSAMVIVYGRRRVGKTATISHFLESHKNTLYYLATEENELQNLKAFKEQVADFTGNELLKAANVDWLTVFRTLIGYKTESKKIIVMDEFQYIGQSNSAFPSIMQKVWDTILKDANIMLILCGSLIASMRAQTLDYDSPLYGRRTAQIRMQQVPFKYYGEFFEGKTQDELVPFYAVTGGVPKYIETFKGYDDIYVAIAENILNRQSYLYEEPYFLLQKEVTEIGSYFSLIKAIAMGCHKLSEIAAYLEVKQTGLTKYLKVLSDLDLIEREVPVTESNPEKSKSGLYRIKDNFIAFWFKFVYPYRAYLEKGEEEYVLTQIKKGFVQNFTSFVYEDVCREKMWELAAIDTWNFRFDKLGRYWGAKAGEIDIVAIDTIGGNIILGECKYTETPKGLSVLHKLQEKAEAMKSLTGAKNVCYIIFSKAGFTQGLIDEAEKVNNLKLVEKL